ncbi:MAG: hypothetical protein ACKPKO_52175, partial [Candidatus Fonsibacter sp.]
QGSYIVDRRRNMPYLVSELTVDDADIIYPFEGEYERLNCTLEGGMSGLTNEILELPRDAGEVSVVTRVDVMGDS